MARKHFNCSVYPPHSYSYNNIMANTAAVGQMWTLGINVFYRRTLHISHSNFAWCVIISGICSEQSIVWLEAFVAIFILQTHLNTGNTYSNYIWWIILYIFFYFCRGHLDIPLLQNLNENKKRRYTLFHILRITVLSNTVFSNKY